MSSYDASTGEQLLPLLFGLAVGLVAGAAVVIRYWNVSSAPPPVSPGSKTTRLQVRGV